MKPLILEFVELPASNDDVNDVAVEYSEKLKLTVLKDSEVPAVDFLNASTTTFTKAGIEGTDTDNSEVNLLPLMATCTYSSNSKESTDSDPLLRSLHSMLATKTVTRSLENSDSD